MTAGQESLLLRCRDETECEGLHFFHIGYSTWSQGQVNRTQAQEDIAKNHSCGDRPAVRAILTALKAGGLPHDWINVLNFGFLSLEGALFCHESAEEFLQRVWYLQKRGETYRQMRDLRKESGCMETVGAFFRKGLVAENTLYFQIKLPPDAEGKFEPGQYAHLEWASPFTPEEKGDGRDFSITSPPGEWPVLSFATRLTGSTFKKHLETSPDGTPVRISWPYGEFTLPSGLESRKWNQPIVFIAGGIGITPFRSILMHFLGRVSSVPFFLFTTNRSEKSIPFLDELRELSRKHKNLFLDQIVSRADSPLPPDLASGILTPDRMFEAIGERARNGDYYIAGTPSLVSSFSTALEGSHILREKIHSDPFFGYP